MYALWVLAACVLITEIALAIWLPLRECEVPENPEEQSTVQESFLEHVLIVTSSRLSNESNWN